MSHPPFLYIDAKDIFFPAFNIKPPKGIELPENFPDCCEGHKQVVKNTEAFLSKFPECCDEHRKFAKKFNVKSSDFNYLKEKIVNQLEYTEFYIEENINHPDWYKRIVNYIELNVLSFGIPGVGLSQYGQHLKHLIEKKPGLDESKRQKLLKYFKKPESAQSKNIEKDLQFLYSTYSKWLKYFPFELTYFKNLKNNFSKTLPFIEGKPEYNPYTGLSSAKLISQASLINQLVNVTRKLLSLIDSSSWLNEGNFNEAKSVKIELIKESHRVKQESLLDDFTKKETRYIKIIRKWLKNEKDFFIEMQNEITRKIEKPVKNAAFNYEGDPENIKYLLEGLHNLNAISENIKLPQFKKMFNGEPMEEPMQWLADKGDLMVFIKSITTYPNLKFPYQQHWNIAVKCFFIVGNESMTGTSLKAAKATKNAIKFKKAARALS